MDINEPSDASPNPQRSPYTIAGGKAVVRRLVDRFYDQMDADPDYFGIRKLHPPSLTGSRDKLFMFLSGWLGGPPLYTDAFGHPKLRARHMPFAIGESERDQWMQCMTSALEAEVADAALRQQLVASFTNTADWMRNKEG